MEHYQNVLDDGLKSYEQIHQKQRAQALIGHDQCIYFRPDFMISEDALKNEPIIGVKVDPRKVLLGNQEIRTLSSEQHLSRHKEYDRHNIYLNSVTTYDQFLLYRKLAAQERPPKFAYSNAKGFLVWSTWLTDEDRQKREYTLYIPEIAINTREPIEPKMFSYVNEQLKLKKGNPNARMSDGFTPLYKVVQALLKANADPDAPMTDGITTLHIAAREGQHKVVQVLLEAKANPRVAMTQGTTPLHFAAENGSYKIIQALLEAKANPNATDGYGTTPLLIAALKGYREIVSLLTEAETEMKEQNKPLGSSPGR